MGIKENANNFPQQEQELNENFLKVIADMFDEADSATQTISSSSQQMPL